MKRLSFIILLLILFCSQVACNKQVQFNPSKASSKSAMSKLSERSNDKSIFKINSINSLITTIKIAGNKTLKGVTYNLILFSTNKISPKSYPNYHFDVTSNGVYKNPYSIQEITYIGQSKKDYLYLLQFSTVYSSGNSQKILNQEKNQRDFSISYRYKNKNYQVSY